MTFESARMRRGFTIVELLVALATSVVVSTAVLLAIYTFCRVSSTNEVSNVLVRKMMFAVDVLRKDLMETSRTDPVSPSGGPPRIEFPSSSFPVNQIVLQVITVDSQGRAYDPVTMRTNWGSGRRGGVGEYIRYRIDNNGVLVREILASDKLSVRSRMELLPAVRFEVYSYLDDAKTTTIDSPYIIKVCLETNYKGFHLSRDFQVYLRNNQ